MRNISGSGGHFVCWQLSYDREHFSDMRIAGTCDILVYPMRHQIM